MGIFVNFSNHPSDGWEEGEREAALRYGEIRDIAFPEVDPQGDEEYIARLADQYFMKIMEQKPNAVLCQGEFCLAYRMTCLLKEQGVTVLAACSKRMAVTKGQRKEVIFQFSRFREY